MSADVGKFTFEFVQELSFVAMAMQDDSGAENALLREGEHVQRTVLFALIPVVVAFSFIAFVFYRAKREAFFKERETAFRLGISELELKVLRTQISPHFIFNCLNSIHHFMHRNDVAAASDYLIKFSRLIRHVLETSYDRMILLADDLQALRLYVELEQLRTNNSFNFEIAVDESVRPDEVLVPPLLIQPFVENAIWHGLNDRDARGVVSINISRTGDMLTCTIKDNGRKSDSKEPYDLNRFVKRESHGMALIQSRLEVINRLFSTKAGFFIDRSEGDGSGGTRVTLTLPYEE